jgi:hypothetical protein
MKKLVSGFLTLVLTLAFLILSFGAPAHASVPDKVTYCQADNGSPGWKQITADKDSVINKDGTLKQGGVNTKDIIPDFPYDFGGSNHGTFAGYNWTEADQLFFKNGCSATTNTLTPPVPTFVQATCADLDGEVSTNNTDARITVNGPTLANKTWTVTYDKVADTQYNAYTWTAGAVLSYTFKVLDPTSDPLWDADKGTCRMPDTGAGGISTAALVWAGGFIFAGLIAFSITNVMGRRKS